MQLAAVDLRGGGVERMVGQQANAIEIDRLDSERVNRRILLETEIALRDIDEERIGAQAMQFDAKLAFRI